MFRVVDLFAGPGGLGEGFSAFRAGKSSRVQFDVALSIEKDLTAFKTLHLRSFFREFESPPDAYYDLLRGARSIEEVYRDHPREFLGAQAKVWNATLGPGGIPLDSLRKRVDSVVDDDQPWVLIGGPPCQAYSLIGRARNKGNASYSPDKDVRQRLYVEYLQILADHAPPVFIMENVKGILSANLANANLFDRILNDLRDPGSALRREERKTRRRGPQYRIYSLTSGDELSDVTVETSVVRAEDHGIPQARHRVILLGVRTDLGYRGGLKLNGAAPTPAAAVLDGIPRLRSGLSKAHDSPRAWLDAIRGELQSRWVNAGASKAGGSEVSKRVKSAIRSIEIPPADRGGEFVSAQSSTEFSSDWYHDNRLRGVTNHYARAHIHKDLHRYMYAACFASVHDRSPLLHEFPADLVPNHVSAAAALSRSGHFADRFRVQVGNRPSTTVVSHISKDGHYYIHPDPIQCRSLTVREAARLQTFPDNYLFCGPRTAQFVQVGNAVPPLLAREIASIVYRILKNRKNG